MATPYVVALGRSFPFLDCFILGIFSLSSGLLNLTVLPETAGRPMPETVQDVMDLFEKDKRKAAGKRESVDFSAFTKDNSQ